MILDDAAVRRIGRFEVQRLLGQGAFGKVYAAIDPVLGRPVAIKVLHPYFSDDPALMDRFSQEAANLASLTHPNVATLFDRIREGDQHCMVMELVTGHTLEHVLRRRPRLGAATTLAIAGQIAAGLGYVHARGMVHRDIKPSNLMLTDAGTVKLMDFGIARAAGATRMTLAGGLVGTLMYLSPEQIRGEPGDARSDMYSLGCVLYEMLSGGPPFARANELGLIHAHLEAPPPPLSGRVPGLPEAIASAIHRALAKPPEDRFADIAELTRALGVGRTGPDHLALVQAAVRSVSGAAGEPPAPPASQASAGNDTRFGVDEPTRRVLVSPKAGASPDPTFRPPAEQPSAARARPRRLALFGGVSAVIGCVIAAAVLTLPPRMAPQPEIPTPANSEPRGPEHPNPPAPSTSPIVPATMPPDPPAGSPLPPAMNALNPAPPAMSSPGQSASAPDPPPRIAPVYEGRVVDWLGGSTILVPGEGGGAVRFFRLLGVRDKPGNQDGALRVRAQLNAFLAGQGGTVACYTREGAGPAASYQCYAGQQDIALWAVANDLAVATQDGQAASIRRSPARLSPAQREGAP